MGEYMVTKLVVFVCFEQIQQICMRLETDIFIIELIYIYLQIPFFLLVWNRLEKEKAVGKKFAKRNIPIGPPRVLVSKDKRVFEQSSTILYPSWRYAKHELEERKRVPKISSE